MYGMTIAFALGFAVIGVGYSFFRGRGFNVISAFANFGSGSTFPVFIMMPFVPYDEHLIETMKQAWISVGAAGLIGAGVTIYGLFQLPPPKKRKRAPRKPKQTAAPTDGGKP
jgi:hypothetical protein